MIAQGWESPDFEAGNLDFRWLHLAPQQCLILIVVSDSPVSYVGHWAGHNMKECSGQGCSFCEKGIGTQRRYVLQFHKEGTPRRYLMELNETNGLLLRDWTHRAGSLRGMRIEFIRDGKARNTPVDVHYAGDPAPGDWELASKINLVEALKNTWKKQLR